MQRFLQALGIGTLLYFALTALGWVTRSLSFAIQGFGYWLHWSFLPNLGALALAAGLLWLAWTFIVGRER